MFKLSSTVQIAVSGKSDTSVAVKEGVGIYNSYFPQDESSGSRSDGGKQQLQGNKINIIIIIQQISDNYYKSLYVFYITIPMIQREKLKRNVLIQP